MDKKILVIIDAIADAKTSILHAKQKAKGVRHIDIVAFSYEDTNSILFSIPPEEALAIQDKELGKIRDTLSPLIDSHLEQGSYTFQTLWHESPEQWLANELDTSAYELVIKTRHIDAETQFSELDWQLIRFSPLPLYLAADNKWKNNTNVLAALDLGSEKATKYRLNEAMIKMGLAYAADYKSDFFSCYTVHVSPFLRDLGLVFSDEQVINAYEKLPSAQRALIESYNLKEKLEIKAGIVEQVIPSIAAKLSADLVIMGTVGNTGIKGHLIGNTAEKVMKLLKTDILVIPPFDN
ncbi:universal stress protein [Pseudoalteromonas sp. PAB 2.2]|uniref:universal stress protein n=1 Tax=Pseudoalteromonas sp. PAB 2.2 TaxID=1841508 RepID=UPI00094F83F3|nr:universal stress protein [Pseudoalteromonas sp. PAB 2.2]